MKGTKYAGDPMMTNSEWTIDQYVRRMSLSEDVIHCNGHVKQVMFSPGMFSTVHENYTSQHDIYMSLSATPHPPPTLYPRSSILNARCKNDTQMNMSKRSPSLLLHGYAPLTPLTLFHFISEWQIEFTCSLSRNHTQERCEAPPELQGWRQTTGRWMWGCTLGVHVRAVFY